MSLFCKHKWVLVDKTVLDSPYEQSKDTLKSVRFNNTFSNYFTKKAIIILQCEKCGKLNKTIEENG